MYHYNDCYLIVDSVATFIKGSQPRRPPRTALPRPAPSPPARPSRTAAEDVVRDRRPLRPRRPALRRVVEEARRLTATPQPCHRAREGKQRAGNFLTIGRGAAQLDTIGTAGVMNRRCPPSSAGYSSRLLGG